MADLSAFPITTKWPPRHPELLQLYSLPTPNGVKVSIKLEEIGLPYEAHRVAFDKNEQMSPEFQSLNPYNKIPARPADIEFRKPAATGSTRRLNAAAQISGSVDGIAIRRSKAR